METTESVRVFPGDSGFAPDVLPQEPSRHKAGIGPGGVVEFAPTSAEAYPRANEGTETFRSSVSRPIN
jgi:hypothetical protein